LFQRGALFENPQVYRIRLDDFIEHRVSNGVDLDFDPAWSPDGSRIALVRGGSTLWTVDEDGGNGHEVDHQEDVFLLEPKWSPDGQRIAYASIPTAGGTSHVYSAAVSGSSGAVLTPGNDGEAPVEWSHDGTMLAYESNQTGNLDLFVMAANGSSQRNLTNRSGSDGVEGAHWAPDDSKLVFGGGNHVWLVDVTGSNLTNLTGTTGSEDQPAWASTGTIFFVKSPMADAQLFSMNANGTNQHAIENDPHIDVAPVPSPDGSMIAWVSYRDGNAEIYVANADGSNPTRVTNNSAKDLSPRWRPCPH
jgi:Tol biopolymer transport system component